MAIFAMAVPILPGKTEQWERFAGQLKGARLAEFKASRKKLEVHERTFLQKTPMGDLVIVTLEGDDPSAAFGKMVGSTDEFTKWFTERAKALHGVDLTAPMTASPSELVLDSGRVAATAS